VLVVLRSVMVSVLSVLLVELTIRDRVWLWFNTVIDVLAFVDELTDTLLEVEPVEDVLVRTLVAFSRVLGITGGFRGSSLRVTNEYNKSKYENK